MRDDEKTRSPVDVVQRQLDAYNARDMDAWIATYHEDAEQWSLKGSRLAVGHAAMRARMAERFAEPDLHAKLLNRMVMGSVVADLERITRNFPQGRGFLEMLCIYEVADGRIARATFAAGEPVIESSDAAAGST